MTKECIDNLEQGIDLKYLSSDEKNFDTSSFGNYPPNSYNYFPLSSLLAQLECALQMSQCILRIERVCSVAKNRRSKPET